MKSIEESDIVKCWCGNCDGKTHVIDSPVSLIIHSTTINIPSQVVVLWQQNGVEYPAYYRGPTPPSHYKVQIDGEIDIVSCTSHHCIMGIALWEDGSGR